MVYSQPLRSQIEYLYVWTFRAKLESPWCAGICNWTHSSVVSLTQREQGYTGTSVEPKCAPSGLGTVTAHSSHTCEDEEVFLCHEINLLKWTMAGKGKIWKTSPKPSHPIPLMGEADPRLSVYSGNQALEAHFWQAWMACQPFLSSSVWSWPFTLVLALWFFCIVFWCSVREICGQIVNLLEGAGYSS